MTLHIEPLGGPAPAVGHRFSYVLAAVDRPPASDPVRLVARYMASHLAIPLREVHVAGRLPPGMTRRVLATRVARGELGTVPGPVGEALPDLIEAEAGPLAVLGMPNPEKLRPGKLRSTTLTVARHVTRPVLLVPPGLERWSGPHHILVPLDGTSVTAFGASQAIAELHLGVISTTPVHVFGADTAPRFRNHEPHAHAAWKEQFEARFVKTLMDGPVESRGGPMTPSEHVLQMVAEGSFDLTVLVWSRLARGTQARTVLELLAGSPVPVLLVPTGYGIPRTSDASIRLSQ